MHEPLLAQAVIPRPVRICGLDLMNYSLGCELQLHAQNSPFLQEPAVLDALDRTQQAFHLSRALHICCRRAPRWHRLWQWRHFPKNELDLILALADFHNYLLESRLQFQARLPAENESSARVLGQPEILYLYQFVCRHVPRAEIALYGQSAWDFPWSLAKLLSQAHAESEGNLEIRNRQNQIHEDYHRTLETARAAWLLAHTEAEKAAAIAAHPHIVQLLDQQESVQAFLAAHPEVAVPVTDQPQPA